MLQMTKIYLIVMGFILSIFFVTGCSKKVVKTDVEFKDNAVIANDTPPNPTSKPVGIDLQKPVQKKAVFTPITLYFDFDSYELRSEHYAEITRLSFAIKDNPDIDIVITGNCDERGTVAYNNLLGMNRAAAVRSWLVEHNRVDAGRIVIASNGKSKASKCRGEDCWQEDRNITVAEVK